MLEATPPTCATWSKGNPLEVTTESEIEEDVEMPYNELASFCQQLLEKYELLKKITRI